MTGTPPRRSGLPDRGSTVGIVTTYHPEPGLTDRLQAAIGSVKRVVVVDNGSTPAERREIEELERAGLVDVIWNDHNRGLAGALNQGLHAAARLDAHWALLLDQDSTARADIVAEAGRVLSPVPTQLVAAIGAGIVGRDSGASGATEQVAAVITSGTIVAVDAWRILGGFREDFFVDYVDLEFCLRARANGYAILRSRYPTLHHSIGDSHETRLLWRTVTVTHHSTERRYAITRNRLLLWRLYCRTEARFVAGDLVAFTKEVVKLISLEHDRPQKVRAVLLGIRDALRTPAEPTHTSPEP